MDSIRSCSFRKLRKRIIKYSWKKFTNDRYFTNLYGRINLKENLDILFKKESIKITKTELEKLINGLL